MTNPYAPPSVPPTKFERDGKADARARLRGPATALIVMASIHSVLVSIQIISLIVRGVDVLAVEILFGFFVGLPQFIGLIVIAVGAAKMGFLESLTMAKLAATLACIPLVTPFAILGIPFGIWSLRLLSDPMIVEAFDRDKAHSISV